MCYGSMGLLIRCDKQDPFRNNFPSLVEVLRTAPAGKTFFEEADLEWWQGPFVVRDDGSVHFDYHYGVVFSLPTSLLLSLHTDRR